jgi:hypothetical protein
MLFYVSRNPVFVVWVLLLLNLSVPISQDFIPNSCNIYRGCFDSASVRGVCPVSASNRDYEIEDVFVFTVTGNLQDSISTHVIRDRF